jgi:hypothetical protein
MLVKNTNPRFGEAGPFEVDSIDALCDDMQPVFNQFAHNSYHGLSTDEIELYEIEGGKEQWIAQQVTVLELDLRSSLEVLEGGSH